MKFLRFIPVMFAVVQVSACFNPSSYPEANFSVHQAPAPTEGAAATISGSFVEKGDLINPDQKTFLVGIDGSSAFETSSEAAPIAISPGIHSLTVGYQPHGVGMARAPMFLDAKPGGSYVIKMEARGQSVPLLSGTPSSGVYLYIEDEKTGALASAKVTDSIFENTNFYTPPSDPKSAVLQGTVDKQLVDKIACYVMAVDGAFIKFIPPSSALDSPYPDLEAAVRMTPGRHAVAIGLYDNRIIGVFPILFDAKPNASYVIRYKDGTKHRGKEIWLTRTIWIEDAVTHAVVVPESDIPMKYVPTL